MGKMTGEQVTENWENLLAAVLEENEQVHKLLIKCKPEACNKRIVVIYSSLLGFEQRRAASTIKKVSRPIFGQALQVRWRKFQEEKGQTEPVITEEMPTPSPVAFDEAKGARPEDYPLTARIVGHYPNNKIILTSLGNAKCMYARKFRKGMEVPVFREGDWLVIRGLPKSPTRYR